MADVDWLEKQLVESTATPPLTAETSTLLPTLTPAGVTSTFVGLVFQLPEGQGVYQIQEDGEARLITSVNNPVFSPNMRFALHAIDYDGDIWLSDLSTGEQRNLTQSPDKFETTFQWWLANPGIIVFTMQPITELGYLTGYLSTMNVDGSNYQVLDDESSVYPPAPGPDGRTIAFDRNAQPWLWRLDGAPESLAYLPESLGVHSAVYPVWSPDGSSIAWKVYGENNSWSAVGVIDLSSREWRLLHRYTPHYGGESHAELSWSPDGQWITTVNQGEEASDSGLLSLWVLDVDGGEEFLLGYGNKPVWDPSSKRLVFYRQPSVGSSGYSNPLTVVEVGDWQALPLDLPTMAFVLGWYK